MSQIYNITKVNGILANDKGEIDISISPIIKVDRISLFDEDFIPGSLYEISGVDPALYGGTTIWLTALNETTLSKTGIGLFYAPNYNWDIDMNGNIIKPIPIAYDYGVNSTSPDIPFYYNLGDQVIWGGKYWVCIASTGGDGYIFDNQRLNNSYFKIDESMDGSMIEMYDEIRYDVDLDVITYRYNIESRNEVELNLEDYFVPNAGYNNIRDFQWGNYKRVNMYNTVSNIGVSGNKISGSSQCDIINFDGFKFNNNILEDNSGFVNCIFRGEILIEGNIMSNSEFNSVRMTSKGKIGYQKMQSFLIHEVYLDTPFSGNQYNSIIYNNLYNGYIMGISGSLILMNSRIEATSFDGNMITTLPDYSDVTISGLSVDGLTNIVELPNLNTVTILNDPLVQKQLLITSNTFEAKIKYFDGSSEIITNLNS